MDIFMPDIYQKNIYDINYKKLKKAGIKCLLFDLDNTIAPISLKVPNRKIRDLMAELVDMGFTIIIMSNSGKARVEPYKDHLNIDASFLSKKPLKRKYQKIQKIYGFKDTEIAAIGDQLLTDILGANRMGFTSILVNPISCNEFSIAKITRALEKQIYKKLLKKGLLKKGVYYD